MNPISSALLFPRVTADRSHTERIRLARRVGLNAGLVMLVSLWGCAHVLDFFGISLAALRIAGGLVAAAQAWDMLSAAETREERKEGQAAGAAGLPDVAFFPLTMPSTTGPGTISVAVALGSSLPVGSPQVLPFVLGSSLAAAVVAALAWLACPSTDRILGWLGPAGARVMSRLSAFLLLCISIQITLGCRRRAAQLGERLPVFCGS